MKKKDTSKKMALEHLAQIVAKGFEQTATDIASLEERLGEKIDAVQIDVDNLGDRIDRHMGEVRRQTDEIARRTKKIELTVFPVRK